MMKKNDTFILEIEDMGVGGEGIGKLNGFPFFVKDAVVGDTIEAKAEKTIWLCASDESNKTLQGALQAPVCICQDVWWLPTTGPLL